MIYGHQLTAVETRLAVAWSDAIQGPARIHTPPAARPSRCAKCLLSAVRLSTSSRALLIGHGCQCTRTALMTAAHGEARDASNRRRCTSTVIATRYPNGRLHARRLHVHQPERHTR